MTIFVAFRGAAVWVMVGALAGCSGVRADWEAARRRDDVSAYERFLWKHPGTELSGEARSRLRQLCLQRDWQRARSADTIAAYRDFLERHPSSDVSAQARTRLDARRRAAAQAWTRTRSKGTAPAYKTFVRQFPTCAQAGDAREFLKEADARRLARCVIDEARGLRAEPIPLRVDISGTTLIVGKGIRYVSKRSATGSGPLRSFVRTTTSPETPIDPGDLVLTGRHLFCNVGGLVVTLGDLILNRGEFVLCVNRSFGQPSVLALPGSNADAEKRDGVYVWVDGLRLHPEPKLLARHGAGLRFGQRLSVVARKGPWMAVRIAETDIKGWVLQAEVTDSGLRVRKMKKLGLVPARLRYVSELHRTGFHRVIELAGRSGSDKARHGGCVVFADEAALAGRAKMPMRDFGVARPILTPKPRTLYYYCFDRGRYCAIDALIAEGGSGWPPYSADLSGRNPVRVVNPNPFAVKAGLRSGGAGRDFDVPARSSNTVPVPDGRYDIYFKYASDPSGLYQGDPFTLAARGVVIRLTKVPHGNYAIRKIR